jgi:hypothetical protein
MAALAVPGLVLPGCGKKGPPLAPLVRMPARPEQVQARRLGAVVYVQVKVPDRNQDGSSPADIVRLEVYGYTGEPKTPGDVVKYGALVAALPIRPPPEPAPAKTEPGKAPATPKPPAAPGYDQGAVVVVAETLGPAQLRPVILPGGGRFMVAPKPAIAPPMLGPPSADVPARTYVVVGYSHHGHRGTPSGSVVVPIIEAPQPPAAPVLAYAADRFKLSWQPPASIRMPVQQPATGGVLQSVPRIEVLPGSTYNVYEIDRARAAAAARGTRATAAPGTLPAPANDAPIGGSSFEDMRFAFGAERCYVVRTVDTFRPGEAVESEPSPVACVTPKDIFPPAAPRGLQAVAGDGAVSLIWEPNAEADLAGYIVLRGVAPGGALERLTPEPIQTTTYSDALAKPGMRYVYAVVAVDTAVPPNQSARSNTAEVLAR